jgi:hypothetical protein
MKTKSEEIAADVAALLRARNPLLWVVTREEAGVERYVIGAANSACYVVYTWDVAEAVTGMDGKPRPFGSNDPAETLNAIRDRALRATERGVWVLRDLSIWLGGMPGATVLRQLRNLARMLPGTPRESAQAIIIIATSAEIPAELTGHATVIEWPLPIAQLLRSWIRQLRRCRMS